VSVVHVYTSSLSTTTTQTTMVKTKGNHVHFLHSVVCYAVLPISIIISQMFSHLPADNMLQ